MNREEILNEIANDKTMPFIQPEQLAGIVDFVIKNYKPSIPANLDEAEQKEQIMTLQEIQYKAQAIMQEWRDKDSAPYVEFVEELASMNVPELPEGLEEAAEESAKSWRKNPDGTESREMFFQPHIRGFKAGAKWDRAKMMEKAVEGRIGQVGFHNSIYIKEPEWCDALDKFNNGDKVKVIVIQEEDEK